MPAHMAGDYSRYPIKLPDKLPYLVGEVCELRQSWEIYRHLFMDDREFTETMGDRLGPLLGVFQGLLQDELLLGIARLIDRDSKAQRNLSLWCLLDALPHAKGPQFKAELEAVLKEIDTTGQTIRKHRHKRLAHYDLSVSLKSATLPTVTFTEIREAIERFERALNILMGEFEETTMFFDTLPAYEITGPAEVTVWKAEAYDAKESEGVIPKLEWRRRKQTR